MSRATDEAEEAVLLALERAGSPQRPGELAVSLGLGPKSVLNLLRSMGARGAVVPVVTADGTRWRPA